MYRLEYSIKVERLWCQEMNKNPPHRDTIRILMKKFEQIGDENLYENNTNKIFCSRQRIVSWS